MSEDKGDKGKTDPLNAPSFAEGLDRLDGKSAGQSSDQTVEDQSPQKPEIFDPPEHNFNPPQPTPTGDSEKVTPEDAKDLPTNPTDRFERYRQLETDLKNGGQLHPLYNERANKNSRSM